MKVQSFARLGYLARGAVYFLVGIFALQVALGSHGGATTDSKGALRQLLDHPFGELMLILIAVGLSCFAVWRLFQSVKDYDRQGTSAKGLVSRGGQFLSSLTHAFLAFYSLNLVFAISSTSNSKGEQKIAHELLVLPSGNYLVGIIGLAVMGFGASQIYRAISEGYCRFLAVPSNRASVIHPICKFGLISRGVVFGIIGAFFIPAAIKYSSAEAGGLREAWKTLREQPFGNYLVLIVALGLISYAFYSVAEAFYRRIV